MTTAIRNRQKIERRITMMVNELVEAMGLEWLDVHVMFDENGDRDAVAKSSCDWQYRRILITWTLQESANLPDDELRLTAIHELCHALVEPLWDSHPGKGKAHVAKLGELVTENMARVVRSLLSASS